MASICSKRSIAVLLLAFGFAGSAKLFAQSKSEAFFVKAKQISLMKSTRADIERMFGFPKVTQTRKAQGSELINYETEVGTFEVSYSTGKCRENPKAIYDVENGVAINVYVLLFEPIPVSELKLDLSRFERHKESDSNAWTYSNNESGLEYSGGKKAIRSLELYPSRSFQNLNCRNISGLDR